MSFFTNSNGQALTATTEVETGGLQPLIPANAKLLCAVAGVTIEPASQYNNEHIKITLHVTQDGKYKDFTIPHKLQVNHDERAKRDKAIEMLLAYDTNCGGKLMEMDQAGRPFMDANTLSRALNGGEVLATFDIWEMDGDDGSKRSGNWVRGISAPATTTTDQHIIKQAQNQPNTPIAPPPVEDGFNNDDIPF